METRQATHAEAVYLARALNLNIEAVWEIIRRLPTSSYAELELAVRNHVPQPQQPALDHDHTLSSV
jgi:hypothetical protein